MTQGFFIYYVIKLWGFLLFNNVKGFAVWK